LRSFQTSFAASICGAVPAAGGAKGPGLPGDTHGIVWGSAVTGIGD
jgi:hypothetical protein